MEENVDDHKDNMVVSNENVDCMGGYNREMVSNEESDVAHSNGTSKTPEMQVSFKLVLSSTKSSESHIIILRVLTCIYIINS